MNDEELQELLRRVRPVGPRPELRARTLSAAGTPRAWPWAVAAAAVLAFTLGVRADINRRLATAVALSSEVVQEENAAVAALAETLGADAHARISAQTIVRADWFGQTLDEPIPPRIATELQ